MGLGARLVRRTNRLLHPSLGLYVSGRYYDNARDSRGAGSVTWTADQMRLSPFSTPVRFTINRLGVFVSTASVTGTDQSFVGVYESGSDGLPSSRALLSPAITGGGTTGFKFVDVAFTFEPDRLYWLAFHGGLTFAVIAGGADTPSLGLASETAGTYSASIQLNQGVGTPMPATWTFAATQLSTGVPASIRMRAA